VNPPKKEMEELDVDQVWAEAVTYYREGFPTYLDKKRDAETIAWLTDRQAEHTEENSLAGMIRDFLEMPLPEDWEERDIPARRAYLDGFDGDTPQGTRKRDRVSVIEIWCELLGKDKASLDKKASRDIGAILENTPGWRRAGRKRIPLYGLQRIFVRD